MNWYRKDGSDAVFFVEATPNEELADVCRKEFKKAGLNIRVIEKSGVAMKQMIVKSNPFKKNDCQRESCEFCKTYGINCKRVGVQDSLCRDDTFAKTSAKKVKHPVVLENGSRSGTQIYNRKDEENFVHV